MPNIINISKEVDKFLDSVYVLSHSKQTVNAYGNALKNFLAFLKSSYECLPEETLLKVQNEELDKYQMLNEFVIYSDKLGKRPATIKLWLTGVKGFLRQIGIKIYSEDFRHLVKIPKGRKTREEPLTKEILVRLLRNLPPKLQTVTVVAIASGMRIGEIVQIRISDIDFKSKPTMIRIRAEITKTKESRETFLTAEATNTLKDYLSRFFGWKEGETNSNIQDSIIFGRTTLTKSSRKNGVGFGTIHKQDKELENPPEIVAKNVLITSLTRFLRKIPELSKLNENGRMAIHFHAFRKFFYTTMSNIVGSNYAHALMGHHEYLDTYYNLPDKKKRELYLKAEAHLTISDFTKIEKELVNVSEKQKEIELDYYRILSFFGKNKLNTPNIGRR